MLFKGTDHSKTFFGQDSREILVFCYELTCYVVDREWLSFPVNLSILNFLLFKKYYYIEFKVKKVKNFAGCKVFIHKKFFISSIVPFFGGLISIRK